MRGDRSESGTGERSAGTVRDQVLPGTRVRDRHWTNRYRVPENASYTTRTHVAGQLQRGRTIDRIPK